MRQNKEIFAILTKGTEVQDLDIDNCGTEDEFEAKLSDNDEDHNTIEHINGDGSLIMGNRGIPKRRIIFKYAKMNTCLKQENDKFWEKLEKKLTEYKIEPKENNADLSKSAYNKSCFPHKFNLKQLKVKDTQNKEDDSL